MMGDFRPCPCTMVNQQKHPYTKNSMESFVLYPEQSERCCAFNLPKRKHFPFRRVMEKDKPVTTICAVIAMDHTNLCYRVCSICERTLPDSPSSRCKFCNFNAFNPSSSKRVFRLLMSIATDKKVQTVICFDRAARVLFGCSADEFFDFAKLHPFAAQTVSEILEGEMFRLTISKPKNGNAQHSRVVQIFPLSSGFQPAILKLKELHGNKR